MLGGGFEGFVDDDAGFFVFDFGVFEAAVSVGKTAGGKGDFCYADHFLGVAVAENDIFACGVLADGNCFAMM